MFVAPLVAEFLLGNLPIKLLPALIVLAPMYGGGALLIREDGAENGARMAEHSAAGDGVRIFEEAYHDAVAVQSELSEAESWIADAGIYSFAGNWRVVDAVDVDGAWDLEHLDADCTG